jgi:two-component system, OmpR family, sensor histidine kinase VicK
MINGFLNVSRLESAKIQLDKSDFILADLVKEMIEEAAVIQPKHTLTFLPCEHIMVNADRDKIGNVISNLVSNAIKYSPYDRNIEVKCTTVGNEAQISVKDNGIGIKPEDIDKLFERYYRAKVDSSISGFGIGLYLCAEIIQRHKGRIWVESELGKGSTFFFSLPL